MLHALRPSPLSFEATKDLPVFNMFRRASDKNFMTLPAVTCEKPAGDFVAKRIGEPPGKAAPRFA